MIWYIYRIIYVILHLLFVNLLIFFTVYEQDAVTRSADMYEFRL